MATTTPLRLTKTLSLERADVTPINGTPGQGENVGRGGRGGQPPIPTENPAQPQAIDDDDNSNSGAATLRTLAMSSTIPRTSSHTTLASLNTSCSESRGLSYVSKHSRGSSFFSVGREFYDDDYSCSGSEDSLENRLDFSSLQTVRGVQDLQNLQKLYEVYHHIQHNNVYGTEDFNNSLTTTSTSAAQHSSSKRSPVVMVRGVSGTGKSTLVKKFVQNIELQSRGSISSNSSSSTSSDGASSIKKPYFLTGKCDELSGGDPYSAIVEALNGFATIVMNDEPPTELERIRIAIHDAALGSETAQALTTIIPNLKHVIVNKTPITTTITTTICSSSNDAAQDPNDKNERDVEEEKELRPVVIGSKENAWNRLKYIFQAFVKAISTKERPVIMFLDDLQWCDNAALELLEALLTDSDLQYLMFIGAYRCSEDGDGEEEEEDVATMEHNHNILQTTMTNIVKSTGQDLEMIHLVNMTYDEVYDFVSHVLRKTENDETEHHCPFDEEMKPLVDVIYGKTSGNIFFVVQAMEELQRKGVLIFSRMTFEWEWNLQHETVENLNQLLSDDIVEAVTSKILNTSPELQELLILAAYTRSTVDIDTLQQLWDMEHTPNPPCTTTTTKTTRTTSITSLIELLDDAVIDGLLSNSMGSKSYSFAHDRIQQAAYEMVPTGPERDDFRLKMGLRLYELGHKKTTTTTMDESGGESGSGGGEDWMLFVAADHLNATAYQVRTTLGHMFLTKINFEVGQRAATMASYETASKLLGFAIQGLTLGVKDPWMTEYETTLQIYQCMVDVELCQGHFEVGSRMGARILQHAKTVNDKLPTQISIARALIRENEHRASFDLSVSALRGIREFPQGCVGVHLGLVKDLLYVKRYFKKNSNEAILKLPSMTDEHLLQTMDLLSSTAYQAFYIGKEIEFLAATLRILRLTMQHGICGQSGVAMMGWTLFLDTLNDMEGVNRFSHLARDILHITKAKEQESLQLFCLAYFINSWGDPYEEVMEIYHRAYISGMESGDFENGHLNWTASLHHEFLAGYGLSQLDAKFSSLMEKLDLYKVEFVKVMTIEQWLVVQHLQGSAKEPLDFSALESFGFEKHDGSENYQVLYGCLARMQLGVYFGNCQFSETFVQKIAPLANMDCAHSPNSVRLFFGSLTYSTLARKNKKQSYWRKAKKYMKELKAMCKLKGMNSYHRYLLAEAHLRAGSAKPGNSPQNKYDDAIATALRSGHVQDAALGSQLAAEYFLDTKASESLICQYLTQARDLYLKWGARGLVRHLERTYSLYLVPTPASVAKESTDVVSCADTMNSTDLGNSLSSIRFTTSINVPVHSDQQSACTDGHFPVLLAELDV